MSCLKAWTLLVIALGNEQWRDVDSIKHCEKRLPLKQLLWSNVVFEKEVISHWNIKRLQAWSLFRHLKAHHFVQQGCFFYYYFLATAMTIWVQIFIHLGLLFLCTCWDTPSEKTVPWQLPKLPLNRGTWGGRRSKIPPPSLTCFFTLFES